MEKNNKFSRQNREYTKHNEEHNEERGFEEPGEYKDRKEHIIPTWLLFSLGVFILVLIFVLPQIKPATEESPENGTFTQIIEGLIDKAEDLAGIFSFAPQERKIIAQDKSYSLNIPAKWLYYNEDYGDYVSAYPSNSDYYVVLSRTAKADYNEEYSPEDLAQWIFSSACSDEDCQIRPVETESLELNGANAQKSLVAHNEGGDIYLEDILFIQGLESYYVLSLYCKEELFEEASDFWRDIYMSFKEHPKEEWLYPSYGSNDSLAFMEAENNWEMYPQSLGAAQISLYEDWFNEELADEEKQAGKLPLAYNYYQKKTLEISRGEKANLENAQSFEDYINEYKALLYANFSKEELIEEEYLQINGQKAYKAAYIEDIYLESQITQAYIIEGEDAFYQLYFSCPASKYIRHKREFENMAASFSE